jgi:hypothetical protein
MGTIVYKKSSAVKSHHTTDQCFPFINVILVAMLCIVMHGLVKVKGYE